MWSDREFNNAPLGLNLQQDGGNRDHFGAPPASQPPGEIYNNPVSNHVDDHSIIGRHGSAQMSDSLHGPPDARASFHDYAAQGPMNGIPPGTQFMHPFGNMSPNTPYGGVFGETSPFGLFDFHGQTTGLLGASLGLGYNDKPPTQPVSDTQLKMLAASIRQQAGMFQPQMASAAIQSAYQAGDLAFDTNQIPCYNNHINMGMTSVPTEHPPTAHPGFWRQPSEEVFNPTIAPPPGLGLPTNLPVSPPPTSHDEHSTVHQYQIPPSSAPPGYVMNAPKPPMYQNKGYPNNATVQQPPPGNLMDWMLRNQLNRESAQQ